MWFVEAPGGPPRYRQTTDKPVQYLTVVDGRGMVLGYVWGNDEDDAAAYDVRKAAEPRAWNESLLWILRLRDAKQRGIRPTEALAELIRDTHVRGIGRVLLPGSPAHAPALTVVEALAGPGGPARMTHPVHFVTVTAPDGEVIGYVWADAVAGTVDWIHRHASSRSAHEAGKEWNRKVHAAHDRGLTPIAVLAELSGGDPAVGPVTGAPDTASVEELARIVTPTDDRRILAQLHREQPDVWRELADAFDALTDEDRIVGRGGGQKLRDGVYHVWYPVYSRPLMRAVDALYGVGAVAPEHRWFDNPISDVPPVGGMHPADAVRAATGVVRGERISEGTIAQAVKTGLLDAIGTSLRAWYAASACVGSAEVPAPPEA